MKTKRVNGKSKGNSFERRMSNLFSDTFKSHLGIEQGFRRNPDSGSFFGASNKSRTLTHNLDHANFGDIICPDTFKFSIECKHYKSPPSFKSVMDLNVSQWDTWLSQASLDATSANKSAMLIVKYNQVDEIVFLKELFPSITYTLIYKGFYLYKLTDILTLPIITFFP